VTNERSPWPSRGLDIDLSCVDGGNSNKYGRNLCEIIACFPGPGLVILVCEQSSIDDFYTLAADGGGAYHPMGDQGFSVN
jgi:hypothetical protein